MNMFLYGLVIRLKAFSRNLKFLSLLKFNSEGRILESPVENLELALIQYIVLCGQNPVVVINGLVPGIRVMYLRH